MQGAVYAVQRLACIRAACRSGNAEIWLTTTSGLARGARSRRCPLRGAEGTTLADSESAETATARPRELAERPLAVEAATPRPDAFDRAVSYVKR